MANYARDELNNLVETLSKEEIYALLAAAIEQGKLPSVDTPTAFVTMIKSIVDGKAYKQAYCTQAEYNQIVAEGLVQPNTVYFITDDNNYYELVNLINQLEQTVNRYTISLDDINSNVTYNKDADGTVIARGWSYNMGDDLNASNYYSYSRRTNTISRDNIGDDAYSIKTIVNQENNKISLKFVNDSSTAPVTHELTVDASGVKIDNELLATQQQVDTINALLQVTRSHYHLQDAYPTNITELGLYAITVTYNDGSVTTHATVMLNLSTLNGESIFSTPVPNSNGTAYVIYSAGQLTTRDCAFESLKLVVKY